MNSCPKCHSQTVRTIHIGNVESIFEFRCGSGPTSSDYFKPSTLCIRNELTQEQNRVLFLKGQFRKIADICYRRNHSRVAQIVHETLEVIS